MPNLIDILLVVVIGASGYLGWRRGFILSMLDLTRWMGSWLSALLLYKYVSAALGAVTDWTETWRFPLAFILVLVTVSFLILLGGRYLLKIFSSETHKHMTNRVLGIVPGVLSGVVMAALLSALMFAAPVSDEFHASVEESLFADRLTTHTSQLEDLLSDVFDPALRQTLNRLTTVEPGSTETVELPFKVENSTAAPDLEEQMLDLINKERTQRGLKSLAADPEMSEVARRHSADMFARGYFSHYTPEGRDPFDRMRALGVGYRTAGENLALAPTVQIAHTGLMNSPGHRANILNPQYGRVGIGIMKGKRRGLMVSQEFRN